MLLGTGRKLKPPRSIAITGASTGFGEALALHYAKPGVTLALTGRNEARLKAVVKACTAACVHPRRALRGSPSPGHLAAAPPSSLPSWT